jgi:sugar/nucleoside kinase (ribokinase family)
MNYDICCLGSALVDITFQIDDDFTSKNEDRGISKGAMTLIEKEDQNNLIKELQDLQKSSEKACGGSGTNSTVAASLFGSSCYMSCIVTNDENGRFFYDDLFTNGVKHASNLVESDIPSGQCLVMISEDAERTMCTNLGINSDFSPENVDENIIKNSEFILLEGYLMASPRGYDSFKKAINVAQEHDKKVVITLSDAFIVNSFEKELKELINTKCDLIFCNEVEAIEFSGSQNDEEIFKYFRDYSPNLVITKGSDGCVGYELGKEFNIPGIKVKAIDTNGAGDMFAGAVMNLLSEGKSLEESAKFGCYAASKTVQSSGPRLTKKEYREIKETFSSY